MKRIQDGVEKTEFGSRFSMESPARWASLVSQAEGLQGEVGSTSFKEGLEGRVDQAWSGRRLGSRSS